MRPSSWLWMIAIAVLLAQPIAWATYGAGSTLDAASPVTLDGQADSLLPAGIASFVSPSASAPILMHLAAGQAQLTVRTYSSQCNFPVPAQPQQACTTGATSGTRDDTMTLSDVTITVVKPLSAYKLLVTTDRNYANSSVWSGNGDLYVTTGATTRLGLTDAASHISGAENDWTPDDHSAPFTPVYGVPADTAQFTSAGAVFRALDGFETFLQGVEISISGTDKDGKAYQDTIQTPVPSDSSMPTRIAIVDVNGGELEASSTAAYTGFAPADQRPITDVHTRASFTDAKGTIVDASGKKTDHAGDAVSLDGPLSLRLTKASQGRLTYDITNGLQLGAAAHPPQDKKPIPPAALAAAGAAGAGGAGALIALLYFWPRLKYAWTLAALPMYTRIERDAVLEHEKRDELYELIRSTPGIHAHEIGEKAHIGWGTTVYHLKLLENHGLIVSKKSGRYKRFFVNTGEFTKKKDIYGALRNETAKAVAQYVVDHPGTTQKELCAALGIQPSLASWHVEKLEGVELVKRVKEGRMVRYFAGPAWADLNVRVSPAGGGDTPAET